MKFPFIRRSKVSRIVTEELNVLRSRLYDGRIEILMFSDDGCPVEDGKLLLSNTCDEIERILTTIKTRIKQ